MKRRWYLAGAALAAVVGLTTSGFALAGSSSPKLKKVTIQLKWVTQSQFAGYYAAKAKGYYKAAGLDVNLKIGGPTIVNEQTVLSKQAEFGVNWFPSLLANRDNGNDLVNIAQVFPRSGTTEVTWRKDGINTFQEMRGKKFGVWIFGNEFEQRAALVKYGMDPDKDVQLVQQQFDMNAFLSHEIDAASAMTYNEMAQVLETKNPATGKLYQLSDLKIYKYSALGTGMLQDGIFVRGDWIKNKANQALAVKFLEATFKGWIYCRDHYKQCTNIVVSQGTALPRGHQLWQMNEINALIWPNTLGIGVMNPADYAKTAKISFDFKVIKKPASKASYRTDLARKAVANLRKQGIDVYGKKWKKAKVTLTEGGK